MKMESGTDWIEEDTVENTVQHLKIVAGRAFNGHPGIWDDRKSSDLRRNIWSKSRVIYVEKRVWSKSWVIHIANGV